MDFVVANAGSDHYSTVEIEGIMRRADGTTVETKQTYVTIDGYQSKAVAIQFDCPERGTVAGDVRIIPRTQGFPVLNEPRPSESNFTYPAVTVPARVASTQDRTSLTHRLSELASLRSNGTITEREYRQLRSQIVGATQATNGSPKLDVPIRTAAKAGFGAYFGVVAARAVLGFVVVVVVVVVIGVLFVMAGLTS